MTIGSAALSELPRGRVFGAALLGLLAWTVLAGVAVALVGVAVVRAPSDPSTVLPAAFALVSMCVGGLVIWRKPREPVAVAAAVFLTAFGVMFSDVAGAAIPEWPLASEAASFVGLGSLQLFLYVFPDGRFAPGWIRWVWLASLLYFAVHSFFGDFAARLTLLDGLLFISSAASLIIVQVYRYRCVSTPLEREQTLVVVYGISVAIVGSLTVVGLGTAGVFGPADVAERVVTPTLYVLVLPIPATLLAAIVRYRLWDIDLLINRTLVHGTLALVLLGVYLAVVLGVSALVRDLGWLPLSVLTVGLIAVIFQPLHQRLQALMNRLMYGERDNPYEVLARLSQHLRTALEPEAVIPGILESVATALRLPYVAIEIDGSPAVERGALRGPTRRWPLEYRQERLGCLIASPRRGDVFGAVDSRLLQDLAAQAGVVIHAIGLTAALQQARERLVIAREEERRRLRRDLHDQLGASLSALTVKAGAAGSLLGADPHAAAEIMRELEQELKAAVAEIRRIAYGLRPPVLDERGLLAAVSDCAEQQLVGLGVRVTVETNATLPPLPAAVELAVFRIAQEALVNVARHARATHCHVRIVLTEMTIRLEVTDDGVGIAERYGRGIGLASMSERAAELGGVCAIRNNSERGLSVVATLPVAAVGSI